MKGPYISLSCRDLNVCLDGTLLFVLMGPYCLS